MLKEAAIANLGQVPAIRLMTLMVVIRNSFQWTLLQTEML
jgi:hypothetical protein